MPANITTRRRIVNDHEHRRPTLIDESGSRVDSEEGVEVSSLRPVVGGLTQGDLHSEQDADRPEDRSPDLSDGGEIHAEGEGESRGER